MLYMPKKIAKITKRIKISTELANRYSSSDEKAINDINEQ